MKQDKLHNYFYKITNLDNGKYYYGIRSTNFEPADDDYWGSGILIKKTIKKYGKENFIKEIIADYPTRKEASDHEEMIVTIDLVLDENCYNMKSGGENHAIYYHDDNSKIAMSISKMGKYVGENSPNFGLKRTDENKKLLSDLKKEYYQNNPHPRIGAVISSEHIEKIRNSRIGSTHSEETKKVLSDISKTKGSYRVRRCEIDNVIYNSIVHAMQCLNLKESVIRHRCKSELEKWSNWKFLNLVTIRKEAI